MQVKYYSTSQYAFTKEYGNAGYDLRCLESFEIQPKQRMLINTGLKIEIPDGVVGLIWPRSGLSAKHGIDILAGVIDSSYRGEIKVCMLNTGTDALGFNEGDRIAQIIFQKHEDYHMVSVEEEDITGTSRGEKGFGSSGNK
jgi:dUTP pyrophosphatase